MGPYPLTCLGVDSDLEAGLAQLAAAGMVSVTLVTDGLVGPGEDALRRAFPVARPFKSHYVVDPGAGPYAPSRHHRQELRRTGRSGLEVGVVRLSDHLDGWRALYDGLVARHGIRGVQHFGAAAFDALAACPGLVAVAAFLGRELVGCHLWFEYGDMAWSHLAASSAAGYENGAAYAIYDHSIRHFAGRIVNLGGAAGVGDRPEDDGLARFKSGFANRTIVASLYGAVLDAPAYAQLCAQHGRADSAYFPAYRAP